MFKKCSKCGHIWLTKEDFLSDPLVKNIGKQEHYKKDLELILFSHEDPKCLTTMGIVFSLQD